MTVHETATAAGRAVGPDHQSTWWYQARCSCGWTGPVRNADTQADADASEHHEEDTDG